MQAAGFEAPARDIYGIPSVIKRWDSGYFITRPQRAASST